MDKVKQILQIWTKLSENVRVRDRSVKVLQYGCQMMLGYYGTQFSKEVVEGLKITKSIASTSRKAFWLLKSFNHVGTVINLIENYSLASDECYVHLLDIIEQLFLILYYFYENLVFISRTKLVSFTEDALDEWGNWSWLMEDFLGFLASLMRAYICHRNLYRHVGRVGNELNPVGSAAIIDKNSVDKLSSKCWESRISLMIAALELGASAEAVDLFRIILGTSIGDTGMGICGVASSLLILYDAALTAVRAHEAIVATSSPVTFKTQPAEKFLVRNPTDTTMS